MAKSGAKVAVSIVAADEFSASFQSFAKHLEGVRKQVDGITGPMDRFNKANRAASDGLLGKLRKATGQAGRGAGSVLGALPGASTLGALGTAAGIGAAVDGFAHWGVGLPTPAGGAGGTPT